MGHRDSGQPSILLPAEDCMLPLENPSHCRPRQLLVGCIGLGQQFRVLLGVTGREAPPGGTLALDRPLLHPLPDQPRDLRPAPAGHLG
ncbi:MAG: hypothetical protein ACRD9L_22345 [Bryobacteraceae bacterium]